MRAGKSDSSNPGFQPSDVPRDGIDGSWSSFVLRVGTPSQTVRVLASWSSYQTWVIHPQGCVGITTPNCNGSRGGIFNSNASTSWDTVGLYDFQVENNLGLYGDASYGYDVVGLGGVGEGGPSLSNTTVGDFATSIYWMGFFGLNPKPTNWTSFDEGAPSYMTQLKLQGLIPSVSFGYTAGAKYRYSGVLGSLTLGGYDSSQIVSNDVEFVFASDNSRDTVVAIQSITTPNIGTLGVQQLLPEPIYAYVDATVPHIWLPLDACQAFEEAFGLIYDDTTHLYLVNSTLHDTLLERNASVTFTLAQSTQGGSSAQITMPYAAFDLTASPPYQGLQNSSSYFPLQRAQNNTQYTLGRAFMQEAYITVDYERARFNLSQVTYVQNPQSSLVAIPAASPQEASNYAGSTASNLTSTASSSHSISTAAIGGISAGAAVVAVAAIALILWRILRRRPRNKNDDFDQHMSTTSSMPRISGETMAAASPAAESVVFPKAELEAPYQQALYARSPATNGQQSPSSGYMTTSSSNSNLGSLRAQRSGATPNNILAEADGHQVYEMPGCVPDLALADGKELTEKELMRYREMQINGVDPRAVRTDQTAVARRTRERRALSPGDVREATEQEGGNPRFSYVPGGLDNLASRRVG